VEKPIGLIRNMSNLAEPGCWISKPYLRKEKIMFMRFLFPKENEEKTPSSKEIIIVSGLPRSGTSMMMRLLNTGGLDVLTDNIRTPDESNPNGYFEFERVKKLKDGENDWLEMAQGKVVKVISALLEHLPKRHSYKVIFMRRNISEILSSQTRMLIRRGEATDKVSDEKLEQLYKTHLRNVETWLEQQDNIDFISVSYNDFLENPHENIEKVCRFLNIKANHAMLQVINKDLYRERKID
jgi:hypothetical protein